jgi:acylphosphatase
MTLVMILCGQIRRPRPPTKVDLDETGRFGFQMRCSALPTSSGVGNENTVKINFCREATCHAEFATIDLPARPDRVRFMIMQHLALRMKRIRWSRAMAEQARLIAMVHGMVQGVGFRYETRRVARALGLAGSATNLPDGRVRVEVQGPREACQELVRWLSSSRAPGRVRGVDVTWETPRELHGFDVG